jgi:ribosome-associated protein
MMNETLNQAVKETREIIDKKFGKDITVLDISGLSIMADYFIIATAGSTAQAQAIADAAEETLNKHGITLNHSEGYRTSKWILMDFGAIIVHIFTSDDRDFYRLEKVWGDAKVVKL